VAGIGSSAGGVEALQLLFQNMPAKSGMAFIVVSHLARDYQSLLPEIVSRHAQMRVKGAEDGEDIDLDTVYVCPPNHVLTVENHKLQLTPRLSDQQRKPIDVFLSSLAEDYAEAAVGILLSGSGSDGALGMKAIKERGGLTIAQGGDGHGPLHSDMPDAAIASGIVDIVAPVEQIPDRLANYAHSFRLLEGQTAREEDSADLRQRYKPIYRVLLNQVGHDFSGYKEKTFSRRVRRRMQVVGITRLEDYIALLQKDSDEVTLLFRDLLIGVTNFFRDPEAFESLNQLVIPKLFEGKRPTDTVRIWCPGCATGEEVYSLAILLREQMDTIRTPPKVQIFATDIDEHAIGVARAGRYPQQLLENVSGQRLRRFFVSDDVSYTVCKELRDMAIFSPHSVIRDPPFSLDLVSCRNLLIYFGADFQSQVIPVFHFALRERGYLFLGTSENVTAHADLFTAVDKKQRIFQRRDHVAPAVRIPFFLPQSRAFPTARELRQEPSSSIANLRRGVEHRVVERFAPAHVVVNAEGDILHFSPRTGKYLEPATGLPNRQLLAMARRGLRLELRAALREAVETRGTVTREHVEVELDDRKQFITLTIEPFGSHDDPLFLVLFSDVGRPFPTAVPEQPVKPEGADYAKQLEHELRDTRERLQSTIEEYETAVEELKSSNEELQSINEELQSTNEELETSKEELQSVNEELHTVNAELNSKIDEVDRAHTDLRNVFDSTQIATIFLDKGLRIRSFTPAVTAIFNLISSDRGRPLTDIAGNLGDADVKRDVEIVLERGEPIERNVRSADGAVEYLMRILPYRARSGTIDGALLTFVDVTKIAEAEARQRTLVEELNHRVRNMLTVVNAIAQQTLAQTHSPDEFAAAFTGRIQAMSVAYGLVSRENWNEVALRAIITEQLKPFEMQPGGRVEIKGPDVFVQPAAALALGLITHELATNAAKHGSLSQPEGRVLINWSFEKHELPLLVLQWAETGGPGAKRPARKGFGTTLIERELKHTLGGSAKFTYAASGFEATVSIPFDRKLMSLGPSSGR
jgi:two-component system, chemotaxis family, CheB/CheR fusion protein